MASNLPPAPARELKENFMASYRLRHLLAGATLLAFAGTAQAQGIPVTDTRSLFQQLEQVRQGVSMLTQGAAQLRQAQDLYRDINKATDIGSVAGGLRTDAMRELNVSSSNLDGYANGDLNVIGRLRGRSNSVLEGLMNQLSPDTSTSARASYESGARQAAVTAGLAGSVGDSVTSRREGLEELRSRLGSASSAAERADMSARLQLEQAQMTNDMMALQAVELQRRAKAEADYQGYAAQRQKQLANLKSQAGID
jgi:type IV secretion system protein VirB5